MLRPRRYQGGNVANLHPPLSPQPLYPSPPKMHTWWHLENESVYGCDLWLHLKDLSSFYFKTFSFFLIYKSSNVRPDKTAPSDYLLSGGGFV